MTADAVLAAAMVRLLAKHGGEDVVEVLLAIALLAGMLLLPAKLRIVAVLPELVVFGAALVIFKHFQASARSLNLASASFSLLTSG